MTKSHPPPLFGFFHFHLHGKDRINGDDPSIISPLDTFSTREPGSKQPLGPVTGSLAVWHSGQQQASVRTTTHATGDNAPWG